MKSARVTIRNQISASDAEAFVYAADMGASVISCSFGYTADIYTYRRTTIPDGVF